MKQYNVFQAFYMSFYSRDFYRDVATNWGGKTFFYLFMLLCVTWLWFIIQLQIGFNTWYNKNSTSIVSQIPVLTIKDGKASTPENRPYIILDPTTNKKLAVIDVSGKYTTLAESETSFLMTQDHIITQSDQNETKIYQIPATTNMVVDPTAIDEAVKKYEGVEWIPLFIVFVLFSYIYRIIQSLIYALIGKIFSSVSHIPLTYGQIVQIAIVALTPPIIFSWVFDIFHVIFPFMNLFYFILAMVYLWYGIRANKGAQS